MSVRLVITFNAEPGKGLECRRAVGLRACCVGFRLFRLSRRDALMREEVLVEIGNAPGGARGNERFAISAHRRRKIRRRDDGQRLAFRHVVAL